MYWCAKYNSSAIFFVGFLVYALLYRPLVDGIRLVDLGLLKKAETWKMFIGSPYYQIKYFMELYFRL
ncbi:hypothetical protein ACFOG5_14930 [Pedobacter fastidiosus]|uniref:hypothetical protein n=1 Tax=Pedobacter fastidiosus TaxID=2765361 RepID=UPI0036206F45